MNQIRSTMSLTSPVSWVSDDFYSYLVVWFLILYICCHWNNQICLMMSLTNLGMTPDPLVCTLFALFLCVLAILLVVLVFWGLAFGSHQQESSPKVIFCVWRVRTNSSQFQRWLTHRKQIGAQIPYFLSKFETQFIVIVVFRLWLIRSNYCSFTKNMIRRDPMGTICRPSYYGSGVTENTAFIQSLR